MKLDLDDQSRDLWDRAFAIYKVSLPEGEKGKAEFAKRFVELCDKFNYEYIGELRVSSFSDFIDKGCDLC